MNFDKEYKNYRLGLNKRARDIHKNSDSIKRISSITEDDFETLTRELVKAFTEGDDRISILVNKDRVYQDYDFPDQRIEIKYKESDEGERAKHKYYATVRLISSKFYERDSINSYVVKEKDHGNVTQDWLKRYYEFINSNELTLYLIIFGTNDGMLGSIGNSEVFSPEELEFLKRKDHLTLRTRVGETIVLGATYNNLRDLVRIAINIINDDQSEVLESMRSLGLNKHAKKQHEETDAVENIATIQFEDPEVERICHEHGVYTYDDATSVTSIKGWFKENTSIESFNWLKFFTSLKEIEDYAFYNCKALKEIIIPSSVTSIEKYAFYGCESLKSINIPNGVTSIGEGAFAYCSLLTSVSIPDSVTSIGEGAFEDCRSLQSINIPDGVTSIGDCAFYGCETLQSINIPNSVSSIGTYAFFKCFSLQSINIPDSVTSIRYSAFFKCRSLETINIPDSVTSIGEWVFYGCGSLNTVSISKSCPVYKDIKKAYPDIKLVDPSEMNEALSLGLNKRAKKQHEETDAVENISQIPFEDSEIARICHEHSVYTYDDAREVTSINGWFQLNSNIKTFNELKFFTGLKKIEDWDFYQCKSLKEITIPDNVTYIGEGSFNFCYSLKTITIPDSVTSIGDAAFNFCEELVLDTLPDSVTSIGDWIFYKCKSLKTMSVPSSVTSIGEEAFGECESLQSINIPDSVTSIGRRAFFKCTSLQSIYISKDCPVYDKMMKEYQDKMIDPSEMNEAYNLGLNKRAKKQHEDTSATDIIDYHQTVKDFVKCFALSSFASLIETLKYTLKFIGTKCNIKSSQGAISDAWLSASIDNPSAKKIMLVLGDLGTSVDIEDKSMIDFFRSSMLMNRYCSSKLVTSKSFKAISMVVDTFASFVCEASTDEEGYPCILELLSDIQPIVKRYDYNKFKALIAGVNESMSSLGLSKRAKEIHSQEDPIEELSRIKSIEDAEETLRFIFKENGYKEVRDDFSNRSIPRFCKKNNSRKRFLIVKSQESLDVLVSIPNIAQYSMNCAELYISKPDDNDKHVSVKAFTVGLPKDIEEKIKLDASDFCPVTFAILSKLIKNFASFGTSEVTESIVNLGLNKRAKKSFNDIDTVDNVSQISFEDPEVESICHEHGVYTYDDAKKVTSINRWFEENNVIESFNELKLFTGLKKINDYAFSGCESLQSIIIPDGVTSIGIDAFSGCKNLKSINISDSVTSIGETAFCHCESLQSITIPDSVTSIGDYAFCHCESLQSITIPDSVTSIGDYAFYYCGSIQTINIPNSVTSIETCAFYQCKSLQSINIPSSVTSIGAWVFDGCVSLKTIYISKSCLAYNIIEEAYPKIKLVDPSEINEAYNLGLNKRAKKAFNDTDAIDNISQISFEDKEVERICHDHGVYTYGDAASVTSINGINGINNGINGWFNDNKVIKSFNESKHFTGLKEIEDYAFSWCSSLESINIPNSVTSIGTCAFYQCKSLQSINIPSSVTSISEFAFTWCRALKTINVPDCMTSIGAGAFKGCSSLKSINIPNSVTSIGRDIFYGCSSLKKIYISKDCPVYSKIKEVYPTIMLVNQSEMNEAHSLGLNSRAKKTFNDTDAVENISIIQFEDPEVERICHEHGVYTYDDARKVKKIFDWFMQNETIETFNELKFFTGLKEIEDYTFTWCRSLKEITIPSTVTRIGYCAFNVCRNLVLDTLPDNVTNIGMWAFHECKSLETMTLPNSVTDIEDYAFSRCYSLRSVTIPDSVTLIEDGAFDYCDSLQSINIPNSVTSIGTHIFDGCSHLTISISKDSPVYDKMMKEYQDKMIDPSEMNEAYALGLNKRAKKQHEEVDAVENIAQITFEDQEVERICHEHGVYTYSDAREVTSIEEWFTENNIIETFNELKHFTGLKKIEVRAFSWCKSLKSVIIPDSVTSIGICAFNFCFNLKMVNIPDSVTSIGGWAFHECKSLETMTLPNSVTSIGDHAFNLCHGLKTVTISDSVTSIEINLFNGCSSLKKIYISKSCPMYSDIEKAYPEIKLVDLSEVNEAYALGLNKRAKKQHEGNASDKEQIARDMADERDQQEARFSGQFAEMLVQEAKNAKICDSNYELDKRVELRNITTSLPITPLRGFDDDNNYWTKKNNVLITAWDSKKAFEIGKDKCDNITIHSMVGENIRDIDKIALLKIDMDDEDDTKISRVSFGKFSLSYCKKGFNFDDPSTFGNEFSFGPLVPLDLHKITNGIAELNEDGTLKMSVVNARIIIQLFVLMFKHMDDTTRMKFIDHWAEYKYVDNGWKWIPKEVEKDVSLSDRLAMMKERKTTNKAFCKLVMNTCWIPEFKS